MKKSIFAIMVWGLTSLTAIAQTRSELYGIVQNQDRVALFGATVNWENTSIAAVANEKGEFWLPRKDTAGNLEINYVGYETIRIPVYPNEDTVVIEISGVSTLMEISVAEEIRDNFVSTLSTTNNEVINAGELEKAACCSLAESFTTNASVDVAYQDAVTGAKEIKMLGLRGIYSLMSVEKRPGMTGLGSAVSLEFIPGTWLESINIAKGASSVEHGYNSITGQIDLELEKPFEGPRFFLNLFGSQTGRAEANIHLNKAFNDELSMGLLMHGSIRDNQIDRNGDNFLDVPRRKTLTGLYRLFYWGDDVRTQLNIHAATDERIGGQFFDLPNPFQTLQRNQRVEVFGKLGILGFDRPSTSVGLIYSGAWHKLNNQYGDRFHQGEQVHFYGNLMFKTYVGSPYHKLAAGLSYVHENYDEIFDDSDYGRRERVPGAYVEYSREMDDFTSFSNRIGWGLGMRVDHHNQFGVLYSPRINVKYNFSEESIIRLSAGRGYRTPNVIAENLSLLASSRLIIIQEELDMESAWNFGVNFTQNIKLGSRTLSLNLDLYRTQFTNQAVMDREQNIDRIVFYNLDGQSFSNSLIAMTTFDPLPWLDIKLAYKYNDVQMTFTGDLRSMPLNPRHRGLFTVDIESNDKNWMFNTSTLITGSSRFPLNQNLPQALGTYFEGDTPVYAMLNAQFTRKFGPVELYIGGENLTNFTQEHPIIGVNDPFGEYFDATQVYAPILGATGYAGIRWTIE